MRVDQPASSLKTNRNTESTESTESCNNNNQSVRTAQCSGHQSSVSHWDWEPPPPSSHHPHLAIPLFAGCQIWASLQSVQASHTITTSHHTITTSHQPSLYYALCSHLACLWLRLVCYMQIISGGLHMINRHSLTLAECWMQDLARYDDTQLQHRSTSATNNSNLRTFTSARRQTLIFVLQKIIKQKLLLDLEICVDQLLYIHIEHERWQTGILSV